MLLACELLLADVTKSEDIDREWKIGVLTRLRRSLLGADGPERAWSDATPPDVSARSRLGSAGEEHRAPGSAYQRPL